MPLFIQLCCSNCYNTFVEADCCSQSRNIVKEPIKLLTNSDIIRINTPINGEYNEKDYSPFVFISINEFIENYKYYLFKN